MPDNQNREHHSERARFLNEFIRAVITNIPLASQETQAATQQFPSDSANELMPIIPIIKIKEIGSESVIKTNPYYPQFSAVKAQNEQYKKAEKPSKEWGKIASFMSDPSIETIECPGPGKPLIVIREGRPLDIIIALDKDEISRILEKIMLDTKSPHDLNFLKVETQSYSVTAIISEFVGSRFMISKK